MRAAERPWLAVLLAVLLAAACRPSDKRDGPPSEVVDVPPALEVPIDDDPQAQAVEAQLVGLLPPDFPDDLPLYLPASLIDFGRTEGGRRFVDLLTPGRLGGVQRELVDQVIAQGWEVEGEGSSRQLSKGAQRVGLTWRDGQPGTIYRFEY